MNQNLGMMAWALWARGGAFSGRSQRRRNERGNRKEMSRAAVKQATKTKGGRK